MWCRYSGKERCGDRIACQHFYKSAWRSIPDFPDRTGKEDANYLHLSEGQKQLCILARTLVTESRLLLLDEPESALDFRFRCQMLDIIRNRLRQGERCGIVTLHDSSLALNFCDELLLLSDGILIGSICPRTDPLYKMEAMLKHIYGNISLLRCQNRSGQEQLVMLKE